MFEVEEVNPDEYKLDLEEDELVDDSDSGNYESDEYNESGEYREADGEDNRSNDVPTFSSFLEETFGWENVPEDVSPEETVQKIVETYDEEINNLKAQLQALQVEKGNPILEELRNDYKEFLKMSEKDAILENYKREYGDTLDESEIEDLVLDLEANGKLKITYKMLKANIEKEFREAEDTIKKETQYSLELQKKQEEVEYQKAVNEFNNEVLAFKSDYFDLDSKDKEFAKVAFLQKQENGRSLFETMLDNPKTALEMFFAYLKVENIEKELLNEKKKITTKLVNGMSTEPVFNSRLKGTSKYDASGFDAQEI